MRKRADESADDNRGGCKGFSFDKLRQTEEQ